MTARRALQRVAPVLAWAVASGGAVLGATAAAAADGDVGFEGAFFSGTGTEVTGAKPESKLWFHDNTWWSVMWDTDAGDNYIFRLDPSTETWVRTSTMVDPRGGTRSDVLLVGSQLYVASHGFTNTPRSGFPARLYRFTYDPVTSIWVRDSGFPVEINDWKTETLVIDRDATGTLWATWIQDATVHVARTLGSDTAWSDSFTLADPLANGLDPDDISSLVAFGGHIGVMWSNQVADVFGFAVHEAGAPDDEWTFSTALAGTDLADDHINLKAAPDGRVFAAVKTSRTAKPDPLVLLLVRDASTGAWSSHVVGTVDDSHTRPIVALDLTSRRVHVLATAGQSGGVVYAKSSSMDTISFPSGRGAPYIADASSNDVNDPTTAKQPLDATSGLVVMASNDSTRHYWHNRTSLGTPPLTAAFDAAPTQGVAPLTVQFVDQSSGGAVGWLWDFGDGGTSTEQHPSHLYQGVGTYTVSLTVADATGATATTTLEGHIVVTPPPTEATYTPSADAFTSRKSPDANFGTSTTLQVKNGGAAASAPHYHAYLRFDIAALPGPVTAARLRLHVVDGASDGGTLYPTSSAWDEATLTWNGEPGPTGPALASLGSVVAGEVIELPLPVELFTSTGTVALLIQSDRIGGGTSAYDSREGAIQPTLVLES